MKDWQAERTEFGAVNALNVRFGGAGMAGWRWRESKYAFESWEPVNALKLVLYFCVSDVVASFSSHLPSLMMLHVPKILIDPLLGARP